MSVASSRVSRCVTTRPRERSPSARARVSYPGMPESRTFKVRWIKAGGKAPADLDAAADSSVEYSGTEITVASK